MGILVAIGVLIWVVVLHNRISALEKDVKRLKEGVAAPENITTEVSQNNLMESSASPVVMQNNREHHAIPSAPQRATSQERVDEPNPFLLWVKEDFLVKLGALMLLLAVGWFASYAFANNWIGPAGRITIGLALSTAVLVFGALRIKKHAAQGAIFTVLGAGGVMVTMFAARDLYDMFTPTVALIILFLTAALVAFMSVVHKRQTLAYAGLLMSAVAPLLVVAPNPDTLGLFSYLLVATAGTLWVVWVTGWTGLILTSLGITMLYSSAYIIDKTEDTVVPLLFSFVFVALYFMTNLVSLVRRRAEGAHHLPIHTLTALGTALFLVIWIYNAVSPEWQSLMCVAWAVVFAVGAFVVHRMTDNAPAFYIYASTAAALIVVATALELSGAILVTVYTFQALAAVLVVASLSRSAQLTAQVSTLFALPVVLSIQFLLYTSWRFGLFSAESFVVILLGIAMLIVSMVLLSMLREESGEHGFPHSMMSTFAYAASGYLAFWVWAALHITLDPVLAVATALTLYTVFGIFLLVLGRTKEQLILTVIGGVSIGFVVFRLLLVEVWQMPIEARIITFVVVGVLLISTAFIGRNNKK